jgi:hypothetical protein
VKNTVTIKAGRSKYYRSKNMNVKGKTKSPAAKVDFKTGIVAFSFMVLILLLVTLLMPRSGTIGIILQTSAGLFFVIDQIWQKILKSEYLERLKNKIQSPTFQDVIPIIGIPLISPLILVFYFKYGTDTKWYNALISISMAVSVSSFVYLYFTNVMSKFLKRYYNSTNSFARHSSYRPLLWSNILVVTISFIALILEILLIYPLSQVLHGHSFIVTLPTAVYFTILMLTSYAFLLSTMYFILLGLIKLLIFLLTVRLKISEPDKVFSRQLIWLFLIIMWTWGGILLIVNSI